MRYRSLLAPVSHLQGELPNQLEPELNVASVSGRLTDGNRGKCAGSGIDIRCLEIGVIEHIEKLGAELQLESFRDPSVLDRRKVEVHKSRTDQRVAPVVAKDGSGGRYG